MKQEKVVAQSQWNSIFECSLAFPLSPRGEGNLWDPIRYENIVFPFGCGVTVGGPYQFGAVGRKHGEAVEIAVKGDLFLSGAVIVDDI